MVRSPEGKEQMVGIMSKMTEEIRELRKEQKEQEVVESKKERKMIRDEIIGR
jgi:hypothetical protein